MAKDTEYFTSSIDTSALAVMLRSVPTLSSMVMLKLMMNLPILLNYWRILVPASKSIMG